MKLWLLMSLLTALFMVVIYVSNTAWLVVSTNNVIKDLAKKTVKEKLRDSRDKVALFLDNTILGAKSIEEIEKRIDHETIPTDTGNYDFETILRWFHILQFHQANRLASSGFFARQSNGEKAVYQIAGPGFLPECSNLIACQYDNSTAQRFLCTCSNDEYHVNISDHKYSGQDWGWKPEELNLLQGKINSTWLQINNLLNVFTITYEVSHWSHQRPGYVYAISFAEKSIDILDQYLDVVTSNDELVYIVEIQTGLLVSASDHNVVVKSDANGVSQRLHPMESPSNTIRESYADISSDEGYFVTDNLFVAFDTIQNENLKWLVVQTIPRGQFFTPELIRFQILSLAVSLPILVVSVLVMCLVVRFCISRSLQNVYQRLSVADSGNQLNQPNQRGEQHFIDDFNIFSNLYSKKPASVGMT